MRVPFTAVIFALELTHDFNAFLPLFVAVIVAYAFTVLVMKRSILTEKISRRGYHLSREYSIDPLEIIFVREVMRKNAVTLKLRESVKEMLRRAETAHPAQRLFPVLTDEGILAGVLTSKGLRRVADRSMTFDEAMKRRVITAFPDEPLRLVVYRMAETGFTRMPVVEHGNPAKMVGMVSLEDLLRARTRDLEQEHKRERVLRLRFPFGFSQNDRRKRHSIPRKQAAPGRAPL